VQTDFYFAATIGLLTLAYLIFRVFVRRDYRRHGRLSWLSILLELLIFALHANLSYLYLPAKWPAMPELPQDPVHQVAGLVLMTGGFIGVVVGMTGLDFRRVFGQDVAEINRSGLYGFTRNPQILAYGVMLIGFAALWPSWYALGWLMLYAAIAHLMVLTEEEHLRRVLGAAYDRYCAEVPRYLPRLWQG
jgi:protein-S-isoprenylcysteine O-methyltransferase Ste14